MTERISRYAKIAMVLALAGFAFLVTFNNLTDYGANYQFVQHVLSMDTTFEGNAAMWRAINSELAWTVGYWLIIAGEGLTCVLLLLGAAAMISKLARPPGEFDAAKGLAILGATGGFIVWFMGFMAVGGEWFLMWQSPTWNGQEAAFRFYVSILAVLIFVNQPEPA
jgi:predicted small integral membrane protein